MNLEICRFARCSSGGYSLLCGPYAGTRDHSLCWEEKYFQSRRDNGTLDERWV